MLRETLEVDLRVARYTQNVIECQSAAKRAVDPSAKAMYSKLAKQWTQLIEEAKRANRELLLNQSRPMRRHALNS